MTGDRLRRHFMALFNHVEWADRLVLGSLREAGTPPPKALEVYAHILGAEHVWLSRINGVAPRFAVWPTLSIDDAERLAAANVEGYAMILSTLTAETLDAPITYRNSAGAQFTSSLDDILTHVALHGSYHRGQIAASLRAAGQAPNPTDYIAFRRGAPAATQRDGPAAR
ncbi:MAG TPA: DinB family protein [Gemmatimonadaceae bacterium]|nr:DinB family protein [Gemmatimonadaceae bacterium]